MLDRWIALASMLLVGSLTGIAASQELDKDVTRNVQNFDAHWLFTGNYDAAVEVAEELVRLGRVHRKRALVSRGLVRLAFAELHFGKWRNDWEDKLSEAREISEQLDAPNAAHAETLMFSGYLDAIYLGKPEQGLSKVQHAVSLARAANNDQLLARAYAIEVRLLRMQSKDTVACDYCYRTMLFAQRANNAYLELDAIRELAWSFSVGAMDSPRCRQLDNRWKELCKSLDLQHRSPFDRPTEEDLLPPIERARKVLGEPVEEHTVEMRDAIGCTVSLLDIYFEERRWNELESLVDLLEQLSKKLGDDTTLIVVAQYRSLHLVAQEKTQQAQESITAVEEYCDELHANALLADFYRGLAYSALESGQHRCAEQWIKHATTLSGYTGPAFQMKVAADIFYEQEIQSREMRRQLASRDRAIQNYWLALVLVPPGLIVVGMSGWLWSSRAQKQHLRRLVDERTQSLLEAKEEAERASRAKSDFLARINHEIRNPLCAIITTGELLSDDHVVGPKRDEADRILLASARHLVDVVDEVMDFTQIETGELKKSERNFSVHDMLDGVYAIVNKQCNQAVELKLDVDPNVPVMVHGDRGKLQQTLLNLGYNAAHHTSSGTIRIQCNYQPQENRLHFEVSDTGSGIAEEKIRTLFDIYSAHRPQSSVGLGLYISKGFVSIMGGDLQVKSRAGFGARFFFDIPVGVVEIDDTTPPRPAQTGTQLNVLLVDDELLNRESVGLSIETLGHNCARAEDWPQAEASIQAVTPDLILLDLRMPEMDGYEVAERIRERLAGSCPPIIAFTGDATEAVRANVEAEGFSGLLAKPADLSEIQKLLTSVEQNELKSALTAASGSNYQEVQ